MTGCRVSDLFVYPVKSCAGIRLEEARARARGLAHDRRWMVVDHQGGFLSQRSHPGLTRVKVELDGGGLRLEAPGMQPLEVSSAVPGEVRMVRVWEDEVEAVGAGADAASWFGTHLGTACELVRLSGSARRQVDPRYARPGEQTGFADGFPYLLLSESSLAELNNRLSCPVAMDRFRPNIVVTGCPPHAEDSWSAITVGDVRFRVAKPCARCVVVNTDQATGERSPEPLRTLASYRREGSKVLFGQNLVAETEGLIRIGDRALVEPRS